MQRSYLVSGSENGDDRYYCPGCHCDYSTYTGRCPNGCDERDPDERDPQDTPYSLAEFSRRGAIAADEAEV